MVYILDINSRLPTWAIKRKVLKINNSWATCVTQLWDEERGSGVKVLVLDVPFTYKLNEDITRVFQSEREKGGRIRIINIEINAIRSRISFTSRYQWNDPVRNKDMSGKYWVKADLINIYAWLVNTLYGETTR